MATTQRMLANATATIDGVEYPVIYRSPDETILSGLGLSRDYSIVIPVACGGEVLQARKLLTMNGKTYRIRETMHIGAGNEMQATLTQVPLNTLPDIPPTPPTDGGATYTGSTVVEHIAAYALSGHRVVVLDADQRAIYADRTDATHASKVLGLTTSAVSGGERVRIQTYGELTEPSWAWTLDEPVFVGVSGQLTQTPPVAGFSQAIGFPISPTTLFINLGESIIL